MDIRGVREVAAGQAALLAAARGGDERAFEELLKPYRAELHAHCYRMLGSAADADDAVQEASLRAWRGLPRFQARSSLRTWLFRIVTNACFDELQRRSQRFLPVEFDPPQIGPDGEPASGQAWLEPYPLPREVADGRATPEARFELQESVELAFITALQHLSGNERAVLLLRDVLGFSARETARLLGTTTAAVTSSLQRARQRIDGRLPARSQQEVQRTLGETVVRGLVRRYMDALEQGDVDAIIGLLTADATWSMPPWPAWYRGRTAIAAFLRREPLTFRWRHLPARANGQPAVAGYIWDDGEGAFVAQVLDVLALRGDKIESVSGFHGSIHMDRLGLPLVLPLATGDSPA
jgi:RNA polymerase sigma-70 factor (ECF subfamily)